jgi:hypothetical protein
MLQPDASMKGRGKEQESGEERATNVRLIMTLK